MQQLHLMIRGRVQGVGFRYFVLNRARQLGVSGIVRNEARQGVEVEAEGEPAQLRALLDSVKLGPPAAQVDEVEERWSEGPTRFRGFRILS